MNYKQYFDVNFNFKNVSYRDVINYIRNRYVKNTVNILHKINHLPNKLNIPTVQW